MAKPKKQFEHLTFEDRCVIQEFLSYNYTFTQIGKRIGKSRRTVSKEILKHRFLKKSPKQKDTDCSLLLKPPYVCNGCDLKQHCRKNRYQYEASIAHNEYKHELSLKRSNLHITKEQIAEINEVVAPLMIHKHHSVNHVYVSHPEVLPFTKSTFYRYIDAGIINVRNIDLQRKVRYKIKKEYDYSRAKTNTKIKIGRFYTDFQEFTEYNPDASIVEMDTVIGTSGGKGGKCFLTLLFRKFNLMLIILLPYKKVQYVSQAFHNIRKLIGDDEFRRLFEVILTDNGTEFSDPDTIECSDITGEKLVNLFYCDPNSSYQKGSIEKNHEYIRYVFPKGTSFAGLTQQDCDLLASHINSVPRVSLNNVSPYEAALSFVGKENMDRFNISPVPYDDINLSIKLFKK